MMKHIKFFVLLVSSISMLMLNGCVGEKEYIYEYKYIKRPIPSISAEPKHDEINPMLVKINGKKYYLYSERDGNVHASNIIAYKRWARTNYKILLKLREE